MESITRSKAGVYLHLTMQYVPQSSSEDVSLTDGYISLPPVAELGLRSSSPWTPLPDFHEFPISTKTP